MTMTRSKGGPRHARPRLEVLEDRLMPALVVNDLTGAVTPTQLVNSLLGPGVTATNITYTGAKSAAGLFSGGTGIVGIESGVVLSTGKATGIIGPHTATDASTPQGTPGDADLAKIVAPTATFDASVLEFDFVPQGPTLHFSYVFGSEEYNKYVTNSYNDVFAFFLNGKNVALLPGTSTPVSIHTVNLTTNSQYYINNASNPPDSMPAAGPLLNTQLDGLTVVLTVDATVTPGVTNHIKLAIADAGDSAFDSNVLIAAGSFAAPKIPVLEGFRPLRYAFRSLEQNLGKSGPLPVGGPAGEPSFDGLVTVINVGTKDAIGTLRIGFRNLPEGVQLLNATGIDPVTNEPFITLPNVTVPDNSTPFHIPVKFSNPNLKSLGTFFVGPYDLDVTVT